MKLNLTVDGTPRVVSIQSDGEDWLLDDDAGGTVRLRESFCDSNSIILELDGRNHLLRYVRRGNELYLHYNGRSRHIHRLDEAEQEAMEERRADPVLRSPMPGRVLALLVAAGDEVTEGQALVRLEAMKMEVDLPAPFAGKVASLHVQAEQLVEPDAPLLTLEAEADAES